MKSILKIFISLMMLHHSVWASSLDHPQQTNVQQHDTQAWNDVAILITSCDKYSDLWPGFFHYLFKFFPELNNELHHVPIYLLGNSKTYDHPRVQMMLNPDEKCWGESIKKALGKIEKNYIFYMQDDYFLKEQTDLPLLTKHFDYMKSVNSPYIQVFPTAGYETCKPIETTLFIRQKLHKGGWCKSALQIAFWERKTFHDILSGEENIWAFETNAKAEEDTRPWLISSCKMINHWNVVNAGKVDPHQINLFKKECPSFDCSLPHAYDAITNPERFCHYGGLEGNTLFWSNYQSSVDILVNAIKEGASFNQVLDIAMKRREFLATHQQIENPNFFSMFRNSVDIPFMSRCKSSCQYPLLKTGMMTLFKELPPSTQWTPLKENFHYRYRILPLSEWIRTDSVIVELINSIQMPNNPFILYDYETLEKGQCKIDARYYHTAIATLTHKDSSQNLKIGLLEVCEADTQKIISQIAYVCDEQTKADLSDVPFTWIGPKSNDIDMEKCRTLFEQAVSIQSDEQSITKAISTFYFYWIHNRPLVRGNGSIGQWLFNALSTVHNLKPIKTLYFAEQEQKVLWLCSAGVL